MTYTPSKNDIWKILKASESYSKHEKEKMCKVKGKKIPCSCVRRPVEKTFEERLRENHFKNKGNNYCRFI